MPGKIGRFSRNRAITLRRSSSLTLFERHPLLSSPETSVARATTAHHRLTGWSAASPPANLDGMPAPPPDARSMLGEALGVEPCGDDGVILRLATESPLPPLRAARFFMLRREDRLSPAIPRPFSIYRQVGRELWFLIKVMGTGTAALASCIPGTKLRVIGPLGNGWPALDGDGPPWVMLGGG